jgi:hypothetical protein
MDNQIIFQIDSKVVKDSFKFDNYSIEYNDKINSVETDLCVIYFSSNEIYYPNTFGAFEYTILKSDKYEWKRNKFTNAKKHIFLRDIHKQWYLSGINDKLNNPEKVLDFLRNETIGYRIYTVGSSAGGYGALLFGNLLECDRVYAFNAQLNLNVTIKNSNRLIDPILFEIQNDIYWCKYLNIGNFLTYKTENYYFQSCYSRLDIKQFEGINTEAKSKINIIRFQTSNHGFPFLRINLKNVLQFSSNDLNQYVNKTIHPLIFSIKLISLFPTLFFLTKSLIDRYQKKRKENTFRN